MSRPLIAIVGSINKHQTLISPLVDGDVVASVAEAFGRALAVRDARIAVQSSSNDSVDYHAARGYLASGHRRARSIVVFLKLEECEVPERLRQWQWVNFFEEGGFTKLVSALARRGQELGRPLPSPS